MSDLSVSLRFVEKPCTKCGSNGPFYKFKKRRHAWCVACLRDEKRFRPQAYSTRKPAEPGRICVVCGQTGEFPPGRHRCKACESERTKQWRKDNQHRVRELNWRHGTRINFSLEDYDQMHAKQNGLCLICNRPERVRWRGTRMKPLSVDHDHRTGKVRGLLCQECNSAIGKLGDSIELLESAIRYLRRANPENP